MTEITVSRRMELASMPATLNGNRAIVTGLKNKFATVFDTTTHLEAEWAWATVERILTEHNGAFRTV